MPNTLQPVEQAIAKGSGTGAKVSEFLGAFGPIARAFIPGANQLLGPSETEQRASLLGAVKSIVTDPRLAPQFDQFLLSDPRARKGLKSFGFSDADVANIFASMATAKTQQLNQMRAQAILGQINPESAQSVTRGLAQVSPAEQPMVEKALGTATPALSLSREKLAQAGGLTKEAMAQAGAATRQKLIDKRMRDIAQLTNNTRVRVQAMRDATAKSIAQVRTGATRMSQFNKTLQAARTRLLAAGTQKDTTHLMGVANTLLSTGGADAATVADQLSPHNETLLGGLMGTDTGFLASYTADPANAQMDPNTAYGLVDQAASQILYLDPTTNRVRPLGQVEQELLKNLHSASTKASATQQLQQVRTFIQGLLANSIGQAKEMASTLSPGYAALKNPEAPVNVNLGGDDSGTDSGADAGDAAGTAQ